MKPLKEYIENNQSLKESVPFKYKQRYKGLPYIRQISMCISKYNLRIERYRMKHSYLSELFSRYIIETNTIHHIHFPKIGDRGDLIINNRIRTMVDPFSITNINNVSNNVLSIREIINNQISRQIKSDRFKQYSSKWR